MSQKDFSEQTAINTRKTYRTTLVLLIVVFVTVLVQVGFVIVSLTAGARIGKRIASTPSSSSHATEQMVGATALSSIDPCQQISAIFGTGVTSNGTTLSISQILTQGLNMSAKRGLLPDSQTPSWVYTLYAPLCTGLQHPETNLDLARKACAALLAAVSKPSTPTLVALNQAANALSTFFNNGANTCSNIGIGDNNYPAITATDGTAFPAAALTTINNIWFQAAVGSQQGHTCSISS
jgi:hypothetical protein